MPGLNFLKNFPQLQLDESKKKTLLIYGLVILCVFVLYFNFLLKPSVGALFSLISDVRERRLGIRGVREDLLNEDKLKNKLRSLQENLDNYGKMLSREKELPVLLESLSKMAKSSHVKIVGITPVDKRLKGQIGADKIKIQDVYQDIPIVISGQSGYHQFGAFINRLENDERYMQISNMKIKANRSYPRRHDFEFVVYAYTFEKE